MPTSPPCACGNPSCPGCGATTQPPTNGKARTSLTLGLALAGIGTGLAGTALGAWLIVAAVGAVRDASDRAT
jgi:hypothetical protein